MLEKRYININVQPKTNVRFTYNKLSWQTTGQPNRPLQNVPVIKYIMYKMHIPRMSWEPEIISWEVRHSLGQCVFYLTKSLTRDQKCIVQLLHRSVLLSV